MKKLLILLACLTAAACNTEEEKPQKTSAVYGGTLAVTSNASPEAAPFVLSGVRFELTEDGGGLLNLTMHEIRFAESMPMALNIVIPTLQDTATDEKGTYSLRSTEDPIVPYIGGKPYSLFEIDGFTGELSGNGTALDIAFTCRNPKIDVGGEPLDHRACFTGTLIK